MFKRVEKRRRKKEEQDALGLDEDTKGIMGLNDTDSDESSSDEDSDSVHGDENEQLDDSVDNEAAITIQEALKEPTYSIEEDVKACVVCPGKLLKTEQMIQVHIASSAHQRRFKHFTALVADKNPQSDAFEYVPQSKMVEKDTTVGSKREEKRKARKEKWKQKRTKRKTKEGSEPPRKRPKA